MAEISFGGLATGLPTEDIVAGLMRLERRPLERLEAQKEYEATRLKAYAQLRDLLDGLRGAVANLNLTSDVRTSKVEVPANAPFTATSNGAQTGSYDVAVAQLAQVQKSVSAGVASTTDKIFGTGTLTLGDTVITIDDSNNSLSGLVDAINKQAGDSGVRAGIINDGSGESPYRMVLTGDNAGVNFDPVFALQDGDGQAIDFSLDQVRSAQQAVAYVDGIKVVSDSNTLSGVVSGVTINLHQVSDQLANGTPEEGVPAHQWADPPQFQSNVMAVTADTSALKEKITNFVDAYNGVMKWIAAGYERFAAPESASAEGDEKPPENLSDVLRGDATVNAVKRQLQALLGSPVNSGGPLQALSQLGMATNRDGTLNLNNSRLDEQLENNFSAFTALLAGDNNVDGVMKKFNFALLKLTGARDGIYAANQSRYDTTVRRIDGDIARMEMLMDKKEESLRARFGAMELLVSSMNSQSNFITQQMDLMNNMMTGRRR
ncbi:flagellar filament capping protein FliD [Pelovirga terrestris]|uniref:Flagellar hook-associated protein 2 n=1 Tax=Pelovirga terrestris TaxID=2771352 RepID=A0A8J6QNX5_9BACT|nr:flagellar filament capping protein FliD [Pelovirga terrestris]MBD1401272.1 flagellar filament capping protein FliD [Pelovirga terrestris]